MWSTSGRGRALPLQTSAEAGRPKSLQGGLPAVGATKGLLLSTMIVSSRGYFIVCPRGLEAPLGESRQPFASHRRPCNGPHATTSTVNPPTMRHLRICGRRRSMHPLLFIPLPAGEAPATKWGRPPRPPQGPYNLYQRRSALLLIGHIHTSARLPWPSKQSGACCQPGCRAMRCSVTAVHWGGVGVPRVSPAKGQAYPGGNTTSWVCKHHCPNETRRLAPHSRAAHTHQGAGGGVMQVKAATQHPEMRNNRRPLGSQ